MWDSWGHAAKGLYLSSEAIVVAIVDIQDYPRDSTSYFEQV